MPIYGLLYSIRVTWSLYTSKVTQCHCHFHCDPVSARCNRRALIGCFEDEHVPHHREKFICKFGSQFCHETLIVEQCALQIYIKPAMTTTRKIFRLTNECSEFTIRLVFLCSDMT